MQGVPIFFFQINLFPPAVRHFAYLVKGAQSNLIKNSVGENEIHIMKSVAYYDVISSTQEKEPWSAIFITLSLSRCEALGIPKQLQKKIDEGEQVF